MTIRDELDPELASERKESQTMTHKFFGIILFAFISYATCFGQSAFQEITPGSSTRADVAKVFGQPVRSISPTLVEYAPPQGIAKVEVEYRNGSEIVERIEVYFLRPISRPALLQQFALPQGAEKKASTNGALVEYFGGASLLALTYSSAEPSSGVSHIGYCSRELFEKITGLTTRARRADVDGPVLNASVETLSSWEKLEMCETAWQTYCDTWIRQGNSWRGWSVPLKITVTGNSVRVERYDHTGLEASYKGTISGDKIQGTVEFCCDGLGNRSGTWHATIRRK
jgi:hypothetical protein